VARDPGALGADGVLGDLDDDLLPFLEQVLDVLLLAGAALLVPAVAVVTSGAVAAASTAALSLPASLALAVAFPVAFPIPAPAIPALSAGLAGRGLGADGDLAGRRGDGLAGASGGGGLAGGELGDRHVGRFGHVDRGRRWDLARGRRGGLTRLDHLGEGDGDREPFGFGGGDLRRRRGRLGRQLCGGHVGCPGDVGGSRREVGGGGHLVGGGLDRCALRRRSLDRGHSLDRGRFGRRDFGGGHVAGQRLDLLLLGLLLGGYLGNLLGVFTFGELELLREVGVAVDVPHVEERGLLEADVHEGRLHAGQHPDHAPLVDVADDPLLALSLEVVLVDRTALDQGHARLRAGRVDHQDAVARHVGPRLPGPDEGMARPASGRERGRPGGAGDRGSPVEQLLKFAFPAPGGVAEYATLGRALEFVCHQASA